MTGFRRVGEHQIHQGHILSLVEATFAADDGTEFTRDVVRTPAAVGVVAVDRAPRGTWEVVLVRQFRAPIEQLLLEIPAGMCDVEGEAPEETAQRELAEEAGYRAEEISLLTVFHPAAGFTDHRTTIVLGVGLEAVPRAAHGIEEQHMTVETMALDDALALVASGEITDAKTIIGLSLARDRLSG